MLTLVFLGRGGRDNRPFPRSAPVSKHKEMRLRLGWTISDKSLYNVFCSPKLRHDAFVHRNAGKVYKIPDP